MRRSTLIIVPLLAVMLPAMGFARNRAAVTLPPGPPALTMPLEQYLTTAHVGEFIAFAGAKANWHNGVGNQPSVDIDATFLSPAGSCSLTNPLTITPVKDVSKLKHKNANHPTSDLDTGNGVLLGKIVNPNNCAVAKLDIDMGTTYIVARKKPVGTGYEVVLVSAEDPLGPTKKANFARCDTPDTNQPADLAAAYLVAKECDHTFMMRFATNATFRRTQFAAALSQMRESVRGRRGVIGNRPPPADIGLWFTCELGCCYADGF